MSKEELKHADEFMLFESGNWDYLEPVALEDAARELQA
jgi:hypothetical protein